ncbi:hypothetical protein [Pendulispora albinea]|uniref:YcxB-like protein domain-containing protein n=1 Tax=Pendulispora albinea TaxID=2741071 RepID=A0ABZ2LVQ2_9BACT
MRMQAPAPNPALARPRPPLRVPLGFAVDALEREDLLRITFGRELRRWNFLAGVALSVFTASLVVLMLVLGSALAFVALFLPIVHAGRAARRAFSSTTGVASVTASREAITVHYGPRSSREPLVLGARDVIQLYVALNRELQMPPAVSTRKMQTRFPRWNETYALCALLTDGRRVLLVPRLPNRDQARFLEHAIEMHLGMVDIPVDGELPM